MWAQTTGRGALNKMNPYTNQMSHTVSNDGKSITFTYHLNATATSIDVMVDVNGDRQFDDNEVAYRITGSDELKQTNNPVSVTISFTSFNQQITRGKNYNWALRANRAPYTSATHAWPTDWARLIFYKPCGVAVNNNPENNYFGTIYATESATGTGLKYTANGEQKTHNKSQGLYIYKSDLEQ